MRRMRTALPLILCGPLLVLTYFLVQGTVPAPERHEATLAALRSLALNNAALQRDVLRARTGMLRNYDPLVESVGALRRSATDLASSIELAGSEADAQAELRRRVDAIGIAISAQEDLLEQFKSQNAMLGNSLRYFNYLITSAAPASDDMTGATEAARAALSAAMLRFTSEMGPELAYDTVVALDRLDEVVGAPGSDRRFAPLVTHGRLIVATLPAVNRIMARLQADPITPQIRAVQDAYLAAYGRAAARAGLFRILIYAAAVLLVAYAGYLFLRLRRNADALRQRLEFEKLIAAVSNDFINLPRHRLDEGIANSLARLAAHADVDCAWLMISAEEGGAARAVTWCREQVAPPPVSNEDLFRIAKTGAGVLHMRLPRQSAHGDAGQGTALAASGIRSWLSFPIGDVGRPIGYLVLATLKGNKRWAPEDIALLRTASEIFANSILRERADTERERLEMRLREGRRLEALGTLAGGIAHEFNNILGLILGYGEMALAGLRGEGRARRHLDQIMTAGARGQVIIDQMLTFGRRRTHSYRPIAVQAVIAEALDLLRPTFPASLALVTRLEAPNAVVLTDPTEIQQVVINLCRNAAQAMDGHGTLRVEVDARDLAAPRLLSHGRLAAGRHLRLAVSDTGPGIEASAMERIFEPFFTTKPAGKGTGLGLATVHGIVTQHGGALNVESRPGAGAIFEAYFPVTAERPVEMPASAEPALQRGAGETILLVDDEKALVLLAEEMLAAIGYEPVGFEDGASALAAVRADPQRFDLVLTDEVMPEMRGTELAVALHEIRPDLPVVLMTGYAGEVPLERLQAAGIVEVMRKPILSATISACLARHLPAR